MNAIVRRVMQKSGLPEAEARMAVETVLEYLKETLPGPVAAQFDRILKGDAAAAGALRPPGAGFSAMFGRGFAIGTVDSDRSKPCRSKP